MISIENNHRIEKSPSDDRLYRHLVLENEMSIMLVQDEKTSHAAATMNVSVGSSSDPDNMLGMAHFLEHMLFLGTETYPIEGEYRSFIQSHGGKCNAFTGFHETNYCFFVNPDQLEPSLDRLSSFFKCPLLSAEASLREINAIHSEYVLRAQSEANRRATAIKHCFTGHPIGRFGDGNLNTLKPEEGLHERMVQFYHDNYSSNIMCLCIVGREPLDVLESWARTHFAQVKNNNVERYKTPPLVLPHPTRLYTAPSNPHTHDLQFIWPMPPHLTYTNTIRSGSCGHVVNLLGHEARGTVLALLRQLDYASELDASNVQYDDNAQILVLSVRLTELGLSKTDEIIGLVFQYIGMLYDQHIPDHIINERVSISKNQWTTLEKGSSLDYSMSIAQNLFYRSETEFVLKRSYMNEYVDMDAIKSILGNCTMDNLLLVFASKTLESKLDQVNEDYDFKFATDCITSMEMDRWKAVPKNSQLSFPKENPYLSTDHSIKCDQTMDKLLPQPVYDHDGITVEYLPDTMFGSPSAHLFIKLHGNAFEHQLTIDNLIKMSMLCKCVESYLKEDILYYARLAGIVSQLNMAIDCIQMIFDGHSEKLMIIAQQVIQHLSSFNISPVQFEQVREILGSVIKSRSYTSPLRQAEEEEIQYLSNISATVDEKLEALAALNITSFNIFVQNLFNKSDYRCLIVGNLTKNDAIAFGSQLSEYIPSRHLRVHDTDIDTMAMVKSHCIELSPGSQTLLRKPFNNDKDAGALCGVSVSLGDMRDIPNMAMSRVILAIFNIVAFSQLRTREQLGYVVQVTRSNVHDTSFHSVIIQSTNRNPDFLYKRIVQYINQDFVQVLEELTPETFKSYIHTVQENLQTKFMNIGSMALFYW
ncbi:hypothetical protein SAMD00019534_040430, partial [Acytostelium subglobosum LB1]|uniref:hypothetical protein n=1 Tax=Acytostelium subglobosum LB1 TaxID=1410327 RepID=UPI00064483A1